MKTTIVLLLLAAPVAAGELDLIAEQIALIESGESATVDVAYCEGRLYATKGTDRTAYNCWHLFLQSYGLNLEDADVPVHPKLREIAVMHRDIDNSNVLGLWLFQVNRMLHHRTLTLSLQDMYRIPEASLWSSLINGRIAKIKPIYAIRMVGYDAQVGRVKTRALMGLLTAIEAHNATMPVSEQVPIAPAMEHELLEVEVPSYRSVQIKAWLTILPVILFGAFMLASLIIRPKVFAGIVLLGVIALVVAMLIYVGPIIAVFLVAFFFFLKLVGQKGLTLSDWIVCLWDD